MKPLLLHYRGFIFYRSIKIDNENKHLFPAICLYLSCLFVFLFSKGTGYTPED
ncbi:hypothetical protein HMPREF1989_00459 [Porphyromonas gingivalis F0566]|nr:hypothetical protein HMPREF1989_00459 [Porphyromonas gingivalis F0566]